MFGPYEGRFDLVHLDVARGKSLEIQPHVNAYTKIGRRPSEISAVDRPGVRREGMGSSWGASFHFGLWLAAEFACTQLHSVRLNVLFLGSDGIA